MKLAAVTMVKNECDIIELFVKINSRNFDFIYVIDHMSDDETAEIIKNLYKLSYPVGYAYLPNKNFHQSAVLTHEVRELAKTNKFDYIVPMDADEFLISEIPGENPKELIQKFLSREQFGSMPLYNYIPISNNFHTLNAPLYKNFLKRKHEPNLFQKIILGNEFAKNCTIFEGNHLAKNDAFGLEPISLPLSIQHAPVRSSQQIIRKAILGSQTLALKKNKWQGEGFHWELMAKKIRDLNFKISDQNLSEIARNYMLFDPKLDLTEMSTDEVFIGNEFDSIQFKELAMINLLRSFDSYISNLVLRINTLDT